MSSRSETTLFGTAMGGYCGCLTLILAVNLLLGRFCVAYVAWTSFGMRISFWPAALIGLVGGEFAIPLAILAWFLTLCGVGTPFFHH